MLIVASCFILLIGAGPYFSCFHRFHRTYEHEGWTFRFSFYPLRCLHCTGRIEELRYEGKPLRLPPAPNPDAWDQLSVWTPVGSFDWYGSDEWLAITGPGPHALDPTLPAITHEDLARGYYDVRLSEHSWNEARAGRHGTPPQWYLLLSADVGRWIDPERMEEITDWPTTQPVATTEPTAAQLVPVEHGEP
ncbi:MAG: hypothetical protein KKI02_00445 [Planctomycetes bacterium]|nr:hypothetical protein [Planctomycetota bacterium]